MASEELHDCSEPPKKRVKEGSAAKKGAGLLAWEHYRNFLDSQQQQDENMDGDVDELLELLEILQHHVVIKEDLPPNDEFRSEVSLLPVLCSVAHCHLASFYIHQSVDQANQEVESEKEATRHLNASLLYFPRNAVALSMGANLARMTQRASPTQVCAWYLMAAECASTLRSTALLLLEDSSFSADQAVIKEWIELLLMDDIVGAHYVCDDDQDVESSEDADNEMEEIQGYYSSSSVEATSRFMAAMLLSTLNRHDEALEQLQRFSFTHRLHANTWTGSTSTPSLVVPVSNEPCVFRNDALPAPLYDRLCQVWAPDAPYWEESNYAHRGYYSYFMDIDPAKEPTNLVEEVILKHLLPRAQFVLDSWKSNAKEIVGAEWWTHTRPLHANLGHQLHFDTDEALLALNKEITHPIISSVLYLTGANNDDSHGQAGATIVLDQTPDSQTVAQTAWKSEPRNNTFMIFPGNLLHGVLPCPGSSPEAAKTEARGDTTSFLWDDDTPNKNVKHRLTFMVGFWTRRVPDNMANRELYGPCGPLPPATEAHSWVREISDGYCKPRESKTTTTTQTKFEVASLPQVSPAWETIKESSIGPTSSPLEVPKGIDHRFFVQGAPQCFRGSLFDEIGQ